MDPAALDFDKIPAMQPPDGKISNFENPYSIELPGQISLGLTLPLVVVSLAARLYSRLFVTRAIGADDFISTLAAACVIAYNGSAFWMLGNPFGPHQWDVPMSTIDRLLIEKSALIANLYSISALLLKMSLLILYRRLFRLNKAANVFIWVGIVLISLFYATCIVLTSVFCRQSQWPKEMTQVEFLIAQAESNCHKPQVNLAAGQGVFSTVSDLYVLLIPVHMVWGLQLPTARKVGICGLFLLGLFATACSIGTLYTRFDQRGSEDFTWGSAMNLILGGVEINVGMFCSCMPIGFTLFKRASSHSWTFLQSYWLSRRSRREGSSRANSEPKDGSEAHEKQAGLPKVPRGTIAGLRSLLQGTRTVPGTPGGTMEVPTFQELDSEDEEYHAQLRSGRAGEAARGKAVMSTAAAVTPPESSRQHV